MFTIQEIPKASDLQFLGVLAGIVLLGLTAIVCYFKYEIPRQKSSSSKEQTAGEKAPEYYDAKFAALADNDAQIIKILEKQTEILRRLEMGQVRELGRQEGMESRG